MAYADQVFIAGSTPVDVIPSSTTPATTQIKASAGQINSMQVTNSDTVWYYVKLFDATAVTLGTTAAKWSLGIPPGGGYSLPAPLSFLTGIIVAVTGGISNTDNTNLTNANKVAVNIGYS